MPANVIAAYGDVAAGQVPTCSTIELVTTKWSARRNAEVETKHKAIMRAANDAETGLSTTSFERRPNRDDAMDMSAATPAPNVSMVNVSATPAALTTRPPRGKEQTIEETRNTEPRCSRGNKERGKHRRYHGRGQPTAVPSGSRENAYEERVSDEKQNRYPSRDGWRNAHRGQTHVHVGLTP